MWRRNCGRKLGRKESPKADEELSPPQGDEEAFQREIKETTGKGNLCLSHSSFVIA